MTLWIIGWGITLGMALYDDGATGWVDVLVALVLWPIILGGFIAELADRSK